MEPTRSTWEPALPFGLPRDTPLDDRADSTGIPWEPCPGTSHVHSFRYYDARKFSFLRRFGPSETIGKSQLQVRFKHPKTGSPQSEYTYFFDDPDLGAAYHAKFKSAPHPGHVVQELIAAGVPYRKQGAFS